jgi:hypothetical protein
MTFLYNMVIILLLIFDEASLHEAVNSINYQLGTHMSGFLLWLIGDIICIFIDGATSNNHNKCNK